MESEEGTAFEFLPRRSPKDSSDLRLTGDQASAFLRPVAAAIARGVSPRIDPLRPFSPRCRAGRTGSSPDLERGPMRTSGDYFRLSSRSRLSSFRRAV